MTRSIDSALPGVRAGLFRPAQHVVTVRQGSTVAMLDLERCVMYATTPFGAESWDALTGAARPPHREMGEAGGEPGEDEGAEALARIAGYLLDCRLIELVPFQGGDR
jgi:hypothetical protein